MLGRIQHNGFINIESTKSDNTKHTYVASITNAVAALKWFWDSIWRPKKLETIFDSMKMWLKECSKIQTIIKVSITSAQRNVLVQIKNATETEQKNTLISHCLKLSGARQIVYKKDYDEPCDSDAEYDSDPDSETEPDYDCYPDSE